MIYTLTIKRYADSFKINHIRKSKLKIKKASFIKVIEFPFINTFKAKRLFKEQIYLPYGDHMDMVKITYPYEAICYRKDRKEYYTLDMFKETWIKTSEKIYNK